MCGRYALVNGKEVYLTGSQMTKMRELGQPFNLLPRYNASPTQMMPVIYIRDGELVVQPMQWWLVPQWSKDGKVNFSTFNAKSETLEQSKLFSPYFKGSRCLIPAEAFYEWKKISDKEVFIIECRSYSTARTTHNGLTRTTTTPVNSGNCWCRIPRAR